MSVIGSGCSENTQVSSAVAKQNKAIAASIRRIENCHGLLMAVLYQRKEEIAVRCGRTRSSGDRRLAAAFLDSRLRALRRLGQPPIREVHNLGFRKVLFRFVGIVCPIGLHVVVFVIAQQSAN